MVFNEQGKEKIGLRVNIKNGEDSYVSTAVSKYKHTAKFSSHTLSKKKKKFSSHSPLSLSAKALCLLSMANNPSQLLPSGFDFTPFPFSTLSYFLNKINRKVSIFCFFFGRVNRPVHRVEDMGDNEGRQGARWDS